MKQLSLYINEKLKISKNSDIPYIPKILLKLDKKYLNDLNSSDSKKDQIAREKIIEAFVNWIGDKDFIKKCFPPKNTRYEIIIDDNWSLWLSNKQYDDFNSDKLFIDICLVLRKNGKYLKFNKPGTRRIYERDFNKEIKDYLIRFNHIRSVSWEAFINNEDSLDFYPVQNDNLKTYSCEIDLMI